MSVTESLRTGPSPALAHGATAVGTARAAARPTEATPAAPLRVAAFAALALFASAHWMGLVESPPVGRVLLAVLIATATAAGLAALGAASLPRGV